MDLPKDQTKDQQEPEQSSIDVTVFAKEEKKKKKGGIEKKKKVELLGLLGKSTRSPLERSRSEKRAKDLGDGATRWIRLDLMLLDIFLRPSHAMRGATAGRFALFICLASPPSPPSRRRCKIGPRFSCPDVLQYERIYASHGLSSIGPCTSCAKLDGVLSLPPKRATGVHLRDVIECSRWEDVPRLSCRGPVGRVTGGQESRL